MSQKGRDRENVWGKLTKVAIPDSRFHLDFHEFIPDFRGSDQATERLRGLDVWRKARILFITPDDCLERLREQALLDGKIIIVTTYGIRRGFVLLDPREIPKERFEVVSLLDGMEKYGKRISLREVKELSPIDLLVTGASAVSREGVRWGKGHGFFDLEWAMFFEIGVADQSTVMVVFVHDCQVVDSQLQPDPFDTICDCIVTPSQVIWVESPKKPSVGIVWERLQPGMMESIPPLRELKKMLAE